MDASKGIIFNIQHYSIHDGPGIRTTVFLKGCPLRCLWCQNPESQTFSPVLFYNKQLCSGCGRCVSECPEKAIEIHEERSKTNRELCKSCGRCVDICPQEARALMGRVVSADEVFKEVEKDAIFYQRSGGGVTLSGGEPLSQPEFAISILKLCKNAGMHTAIDTCGLAPWETIKKVLEYVDLVLYDLKHMDPKEHEKATGVSNSIILDNARKICRESSASLMIRIPIIPGFNDSIENIKATATFVLQELDPSIPIHLLPYHKLGESKYEQMEVLRTPLGIEAPSEEHLQELKTVLESQGLIVTTGG